MDLGSWIGTSSLALSLAVLVFGLIQYKQMSRKDYVDELSKRIDRCEERHAASERAREDCERDRDRLIRQTTALMMDLRAQADEKLKSKDDDT